MNARVSRDYDYIAWDGRTPYAAAPATAPEPVVIDTTQIRLVTERELRYWTSELRVTIYALRDAIAATGTRCAIAVREYLQQHDMPLLAQAEGAEG